MLFQKFRMLSLGLGLGTLSLLVQPAWAQDWRQLQSPRNIDFSKSWSGAGALSAAIQRWVPKLTSKEAEAAKAAPVTFSAAELAAALPAVQLRTIVIDPGHGGSNEGAHGLDGQVEKEMTLEMAERLARGLQKRLPQAKIVLTREDDRELSLTERIEMANALEADLFLSLHFNSSHNPEAHGFESFWVGEYLADGDLPALREAALRSRWMGLCFNLKMAERFSAPDRGVKSGDFTVLTKARVPAVVIEFAFLSHAEEGAESQKARWQAKAARALESAVILYSKGKRAL